MLSSAGPIIGAASQTELDTKLDGLAADAGSSRDDLVEQLEKRGTPVGTYGQLREQFTRLEDLGITRFYIQGIRDNDYRSELLDALRS